MIDLSDAIYERVLGALETIANDERAEIYVVSLFVYDEADDPLRPTITVGYNTESDVVGAADQTDEDEARWNYAFYRQNELAVLFEGRRDPDGAALRDDAIESAGYTFPSDRATQMAVTAPWFVANTVFAARRLHDTGDVMRIFGKAIPILVHELEYYDVIAMQNLAANPPGVADDFVRWCRGLGSA